MRKTVDAQKTVRSNPIACASGSWAGSCTERLPGLRSFRFPFQLAVCRTGLGNLTNGGFRIVDGGTSTMVVMAVPGRRASRNEPQ
jgi:hypothetical protein